MFNSQELLEKVAAMCQTGQARLLYLCKFGSHLYGTDSPNSDLDLRGIFLPGKTALYLEKAPKSLRFSTGDDHNRNAETDMDIDLWSLQYWLLKLLPEGDTNALDMLFSPTNISGMLYMDPLMPQVFKQYKQFINLDGTRGYAGYALGQAKKYGIRGSRLGVIKCIKNWLDAHNEQVENSRTLNDFVDSLVYACGDDAYCQIKEINTEKALIVCGKYHICSIKPQEFARRINDNYEQYGERSRLAEQNQGIDWKALSHAMRALFQVEELVKTGKIVYPLKSATQIKEIKAGKYPWLDVEKMIVDKLAEITNLCQNCGEFKNFNHSLAEELILNFYINESSRD